jgi:pimeloyl-ACP methyl ester carboxylesterase
MPRASLRAGGAAPVQLAAWRGGGEGAVGFLFLHAIGLSHHSWLETARRVAAARPVLALTLAGFGASDLAPDRDYSLAAQARRALAAARDAGPPRWVLVGNSLGGAVALAGALASPEQVAGLVLVNAAAYRRGLPWLGHLGRLWGSHHLLRAAPAWTLRAGIAVGAGTRGWTTAAHGQRCRQALGRRGGSDAFTRSLRVLYGHELDQLARRYPAVACPALVLRGEHDPLIPAWVAERLAGELPNARHALLPGLGHFPQEENPALLAEHCLAFSAG